MLGVKGRPPIVGDALPCLSEIVALFMVEMGRFLALCQRDVLPARSSQRFLRSQTTPAPFIASPLHG